MQNSFVLSLIQNIAILLSFSMIYDYVWTSIDKRNILWYNIAGGIFLSIVGYVLISTPWTMMNGIFFDSRTIMLSIAGLFFGTIPTIIAIVFLSVYRFTLGGIGVWMGIATIVTSGLIGVLWQHFRPDWHKRNRILELLTMALLVHLAMLGCTILLPTEISVFTLLTILIPVTIIYPTATVLLGLLMLHQTKNRKNKEALKVSEERWRFAIDGSGDGLWDWDNIQNKVFLSTQIKNFLEYDNNEIPNYPSEWSKGIHPDDVERVLEEVREFLEGKVKQLDTEYRILTKSMNYIWIHDRGMVMNRDKEGKAIRSIGTHRNITQRKLTEQALLESQKYTNSILTAIPDLIFVVNVEGEIIDFKSGKKSDFYLQPEDFMNKKIIDYMPADITQKAMTLVSKVLETNQTEMFEYELQIGNETKYFESHLLAFAETKVICLVRNITARKKAEQQLLASQTELKKFAAHLQNIREEERINLAREIHDEMGQILVAVKMDLGMVQKKANHFIDADDSGELKTQFLHLSTLVDKTIKTSRRIMTDLRPEVLDIIGVIDAIRQHALKFEKRYSIKCIFNSEIENLELSKDQSVALFRIIQEALINIGKHAQATEASILLGLGDKDIYLEIADNGIGFDSKNNIKRESYGLIGMSERAYLLDGHCNIESSPGKGTKISVTFPYLERIDES